MFALPLAYLPSFKRELRAAWPGMASGHLSEALAFAAGFRTHAALTQAQPRAIALQPDRLFQRLHQLGYPLASKATLHSTLLAWSRNSLAGLGYAPDQIQAFDSMLKGPPGAILVTAPSGEGKSALLRTLLERPAPGQNVPERPAWYTLEAPVEADMHHAIQRGVAYEGFAAAMNEVMALDPERVLLSEVRDSPSALALVRAAGRGVRTFAAVHADSPTGIIQRLRRWYASPRPSDISGLVHQRLLPQVCPGCARPLSPGPLRATLDNLFGAEEVTHLRERGAGCVQCASGYSHRTVCATVVPGGPVVEQTRPGQPPLSEGCPIPPQALFKMRMGLIDPRDIERAYGDLRVLRLYPAARPLRTVTEIRADA